MGEPLIYEQPLNEQMRICLRVEHLFECIKMHIAATTVWQSTFALSHLIELLGVIERPDLKSKLVKAMSDMRESLDQLAKRPDVSEVLDQHKLDQVQDQLHHFLGILHQRQARIGQLLYTNAFLKSLRCYLATPGGSCHFNAPEYHWWLRQPASVRQRDLQGWISQLDQLRDMVSLLLSLVRKRAEPASVLAIKGFYQCHLNPKKLGQMMRVFMENDKMLYPVFSVGPRLCALHFYTPCFHDTKKSVQYEQDVSFRLAYCAL